MARRWGAQVWAEWSQAVQGMAVTMRPNAAAALARDPRVLLVEENGRVYASAIQSPATWGLDRIDQRDRSLSDSYRYDVEGSGVTAYILDTGIRVTHEELSGRAYWGVNETGDGFDGDCDGHGTHVAGTIGGTTYGVAKGITLVAIKVLDCNGDGTDSGVISGIDWMIADQADKGNLPAVANLSLSGGYSSALNLAIQNATAAGVTMVAAAGTATIQGRSRKKLAPTAPRCASMTAEVSGSWSGVSARWSPAPPSRSVAATAAPSQVAESTASVDARGAGYGGCSMRDDTVVRPLLAGSVPPGRRD